MIGVAIIGFLIVSCMLAIGVCNAPNIMSWWYERKGK